MAILILLVFGCIASVVNGQSTLLGNCRTPDPIGSLGICTPIGSCIPMIIFLDNFETIGTTAKQILRQYTCGNSTEGDIWVCCPFKPIKQLSAKYREILPLIEHSDHPNIRLLPISCGSFRNDRKIVNGDAAALYEFPWAAALKYKTGNTIDFLCGGSLINNRYVLTAAHCVRDPSNEIIGVRLGELNFTTNPDCEMFGDMYRFCAPPHQDFNITTSDIIVHPDYNATSLHNDIALIRLRTEANTTNYSVEPICLPVTIEQKARNISMYTTIGWGKAFHFETRSNILRKTHVPAQSNDKCSYLNPIGKELTQKQLCAGGKYEVDVCNGDSGGSLIGEYFKNNSLKSLLYGILSFGPRICNHVNFPATYTKVASYMDWILDNIEP